MQCDPSDHCDHCEYSDHWDHNDHNDYCVLCGCAMSEVNVLITQLLIITYQTVINEIIAV